MKNNQRLLIFFEICVIVAICYAFEIVAFCNVNAYPNLQ